MKSRLGWLPRVGIAVAGSLWVLAVACRYPLDGLYALPLERPPTAADWDGATPLERGAVGGRSSAPAEGDVDADAVHTTTASCHHGAKVPPVPVQLRAFWTPERLYLQVRWDDPTDSRGPLWRWDGRRWQAAAPGSDGVGILWGSGAGWNCAQVCHLRDWRMAGQRAMADYAMAVEQGPPPLDFWVWRAGYGSTEGMAVDAVLGADGRRDDGGDPEESFFPNSVQAASGGSHPFGEGDRPVTAPDPAPGAQAPGFSAARLPAARTELTAQPLRTARGWSLTLSRPLAASEAGDVGFAPGGEYPFGLSILDAVDRDHLVVPETIHLRLVAAERP
ncbi:MAG TPA: ethylbenzene dehydrogenase-related protein [Deferrisomatales bacterium]|nr:ethylbenzene dehydrogenase-related protein [Deferrisomatales bacterium]